ncbi:MAG: hypothetical protein WC644_01175 [Ignavibacteria bacterium]
MNDSKPKPLNQDFFRRIGQNEGETNLDLVPAADYMKNYLTKEIKFKDLNEKLMKSRQEKVVIKEILLESEVELISSLKQLKTVFKDELKQAIDKLNDMYTNELMKLQQLYRSEVIGDKLLEIVKTVASSGWYLLMKDSSVNLCKFYDPPFEVQTGISSDKGHIKEYVSPVCYLKAIFVNILHTKITTGTIRLSTENQHPNADKNNFGTACNGTFEDKEIPLDDPEQLRVLLDEISSTYERIHLDSCYYTPLEQSKTRKDNTWKVKTA